MGQLASTVQYIEAHQAAFMVAFTGVIMCATLLSLLVTIYLARENRILRKAGTEPEVVGYLTTNERYPSMINFHMKNIGNGPALNVEYRALGDVQKYVEEKVELPLNEGRPPLAVLPQDEKFTTFFGDGNAMVVGEDTVPVELELSYSNMLGHVVKRKISLNVGQFEGFSWVGKPASHDAVKALESIEKTLSGIARGSSAIKVTATSPEGWRREEELRREEMERIRAGRQV